MNIIVGDQLIEYKDDGSGQVVLLLHGWGVDLNTFDQLTNHLSIKFRVIRLSFPGFGNSPRPSDDWAVIDYARLTGDFLKKLNITKPYAVIAHSFGGRVAIKGISQGFLGPERVVFMDIAGVKPKLTLKKNLYKIVAKTGKVATVIPGFGKVRPVLRRYLYSKAGSIDYLLADEMKRIFLNVINEDLLPEISKNTHPTLLIWGEDDQETPSSDATSILKLLDSGKLVVIPNAGHFVYIDAYEEVYKRLDDFLR
jgi:pimeloyl-ACP methyl ester carboxylesterase